MKNLYGPQKRPTFHLSTRLTSQSRGSRCTCDGDGQVVGKSLRPLPLVTSGLSKLRTACKCASIVLTAVSWLISTVYLG